MNRVDRLIGYLLLFQSRGLMRAQDFSEQFEISERTVYRDIQALCEVGVPIVAMPGEGYRLMEGYYLPPITFSSAEARALYLAISMLSGLTATGATQRAAATALEKIRVVLPAATLRQVEALEAIINFYALPGTALNFDDEKFLTLQEAAHRHRLVHLRYHTLHSNQVTERDVEPFELIFLEKAWMLSAYCRLRQAIRIFRLDRIDALTVYPETFAPRDLERQPPDPAKRLTVVVHFEASTARWVREKQHFSFEAEKLAAAGDPTRGIVMTYRPHSLKQIEGWLLSWGSQMTVLEPAELRDRLVATADRIIRRHRSSADITRPDR